MLTTGVSPGPGHFSGVGRLGFSTGGTAILVKVVLGSRPNKTRSDRNKSKEDERCKNSNRGAMLL